MKEIISHEQDEVRNLNPEQIAKESTMVFKMRPIKGHRIFEFNVLANTIKEAEFSKPSVANFVKAQKGEISGNKRIDIQPGCLYMPALNAKNAIKQFKKRFPNMKTPEIIKTLQK